jgi:LacI family transcriptional regulator
MSRGHAEALAAAGLAPSDPLIGDWSEAWGYEAAARLLADPSRVPDAVFCGNDQIARGMIDGFTRRGLAVPGDVAVIGFDNWEIFAAASRPPLTTVDMNLKDLGRHAGLTLLDLVEGRSVAPGIRALPCRLVVRASCG